MAEGNISHQWHKKTSESSVTLLFFFTLSQGNTWAEELNMPSIKLG